MRNPARVLCTAALALSVLGGTVATHAMDYMDGSAVRGHGGDLASLYAFMNNDNGKPGPLAVMLSIKPFACLLYTSPSPRDVEESRMPSSA